MPPASTARGTAYLTALTLEIEKKLQRALASASQRRNLLQELFADVALEVDDRAKEIILGEEDAITASDESYSSPLCFYNVLANHFARMPENGKSILDLIVQLWSQSFASNIFSLLFHKWLFEFQLDNPVVLLRFSSALVQGAANVFCLREHLSEHLKKTIGFRHKHIHELQQARDLGDDFFEMDANSLLFVVPICSMNKLEGETIYISYERIDIQTNVRRFQSFFQYLLMEVALDSERLEKIPPQAQRDLFLLISRVILFYNSDDKLESFFKQFPDFPNAFLVGSAADIFVIELADQLQKLKVEPVLLYYLSRIKVLQGLELRLATSTRLKTCLYSFTSPGGPMYPTRAVRHAAWDALDFLFPVGRYPRHLISLFFRLLYPWYWPSSCWNFVLSCIQAVMYSLLRLIFSSWEKLRPKQS